MAGRRMLPHVVTLFNYAGEDADGRAIYSKTVLRTVYCTAQTGTDFDREGKKSTNKAVLYFFDTSSVAESEDGAPKQFMPYALWVASDSSKEPYWTLSDQGDDYFVQGETDAARPQDVHDAFKIVNAKRYEAGQKRMWHWTVTGR